MESFSLMIGEGKYQIHFHVLFCGKDASVCIFGGDVPHIGAVAVGVFRESLTGNGSPSSSASIICITGHKEDELARQASLRLSSSWQCNVTVCAGIHVNDATKEDIIIIGQYVDTLIKQAIDRVKDTSPTT